MASVAHSYLFVPGNRPDRFGKACAAGADAVIIDLEDAVPPTEKSSARVAVEAWLTQHLGERLGDSVRRHQRRRNRVVRGGSRLLPPARGSGGHAS